MSMRKISACEPFEVIVGKSMSEDGEFSKSFGFVNRYDTRPKRRLFEMLTTQGMQMNQTVSFLSDGGDTVRDLQMYLNRQAEHLLDWFHVTMRLTVMGQIAKSIVVSLRIVRIDLLPLTLARSAFDCTVGT
jgi:hypothetical protein